MCSVTQPLWYYLLLSVGRDKMGCRLMTVLLLKQWKVWITGNHLQVKGRALVIGSCVVLLLLYRSSSPSNWAWIPNEPHMCPHQGAATTGQRLINAGGPRLCIRPEQPELPSSYKPEGKEMDHNSSSGFSRCVGVHPHRKLQPSPRNQTHMQPVESQNWSTLKHQGFWQLVSKCQMKPDNQVKTDDGLSAKNQN